MTKYDEYCYNIMEAALKMGAEGSGLTKETCTGYMNIILGVRGIESYIRTKESEVSEDGEKMED